MGYRKYWERQRDGGRGMGRKGRGTKQCLPFEVSKITRSLKDLTHEQFYLPCLVLTASLPAALDLLRKS